MTDNDNSHKGGRPKSAKGKVRSKTLSTRLTLAEWKTVMKRITDAGKKPSHFLRELLLHGKVVAARPQEDRRQIRMLEGRVQQPEPTGEAGAPAGLSGNQR